MRKVISILCLSLVMGALCASGAQEQVSVSIEPGIISVEGGFIQGVPSDTEGVIVYKGVPFAAPPTGENRWRAPQDVLPWDGVKVCNTWPAMPIQDKSGNKPGVSFYGDEFYYSADNDVPVSEDCLYMNIYTPATAALEGIAKYPVFFYIHGGGNDHGYASKVEFNAAQLAAKGIVVVVIQYRLGALGFLAHPELSAEAGGSGNYALMDMVKGLEWTRDNIAAFGGDKDNVTIGGQSAGAMNTRSLLSVAAADGLYQRAIIQSGFNSNIATFAPVAKEQAEAAGASLVASVFGEGTTIADLRKMDESVFVDMDILKNFINKSKSATLDGVVIAPEHVNISDSGRLDGKQILIGGTSNEMTSLSGNPANRVSQEAFYGSLAKTYGVEFCEANNVEEAFPYVDARVANSDSMQVSSHSVLMATRFNTMNRDADYDCYVYLFDQVPPKHYPGITERDEEFYGAFHSGELWYTFSSLREIPQQRMWTEQDLNLADTVSSYWANFITYGNPNGNNLSGWATCEAENDGAYMLFADGEAQLVTSFENEAKEMFFRNSLGWN